MRETIAVLRGLIDQDDIERHAHFRDKCLHFQTLYRNSSYDVNEAVKIDAATMPSPDFLAFCSEREDKLRAAMPDLLELPESWRMLWMLLCTPHDACHSQLASLYPSLDAIAYAYRGGPNLYKLCGWLVHVLVCYEMLVRWIPAGCPPATCEWPAKVSEFFATDLRLLYEALDPECRTILHVSALAHDIGVRVEIPDHDKHGAPLVIGFLGEMGIDADWTASRLQGMGFEDFAWSCEQIVRYHSFINRIGVEFSLARAASELSGILAEGSVSSWRRDFLRRSFGPMLFMFLVADLIAVNEVLLTEHKIEEMSTAYVYFRALLEQNNGHVDSVEGGYQRFRAFTSDAFTGLARDHYTTRISAFGYEPNAFWRRLFGVDEFSFGLSLLKHLPNEGDSLHVLLLAIACLDSLGEGEDGLSAERIVFSHELEGVFFLTLLAQSTELNRDFVRARMRNGVLCIGDICFRAERTDGKLTVSIAKRETSSGTMGS